MNHPKMGRTRQRFHHFEEGPSSEASRGLFLLSDEIQHVLLLLERSQGSALNLGVNLCEAKPGKEGSRLSSSKASANLEQELQMNLEQDGTLPMEIFDRKRLSALENSPSIVAEDDGDEIVASDVLLCVACIRNATKT